VHFNGELLKVKTFQDYCDLYLGDVLKVRPSNRRKTSLDSVLH